MSSLAGGVESMSRVRYYTTDMRARGAGGQRSSCTTGKRGRERSQPVERFGASAA